MDVLETQTESCLPPGVRMFLSVELGPETRRFGSVGAHVTEERWDMLKRMAYARAGRRCEVCGAGPRVRLDVDEVWEFDDELRVQKLAGLQALCVNCLRARHAVEAEDRGERGLVVEHLMRVNGWGEPEAAGYLRSCFEALARRSGFRWTLDVSCLEPYGIYLAVARPETA